ncbi:outer membrane protein HorD [Helicobacter sp. NHP21005]|uniref:outer membrane protein n=1 Tax=Helicobacter felistomachi TaxID=3040201 RepID=UPI0025731F0B|nr:outer membrane protein [Helicobacter sp. NHP21005]BEG57991.1 outer membrane protein HorD [Helicobacter sp. NHP21005]
MRKLALVAGAVCILLPPLQAAKSRTFLLSQYQVGQMQFYTYQNGTPVKNVRTIEGASIVYGYEFNPLDRWFYTRYYAFLDYGYVMLDPKSNVETNMFTYGAGADLLIEYNKNPLNVWGLFYGMMVAGNTWTTSEFSQNFFVENYRSFTSFSFKGTYFRLLGQVGVRFQTVILYHDVSFEFGIKFPFDTELGSRFVRNYSIFISHTWYF